MSSSTGTSHHAARQRFLARSAVRFLVGVVGAAASGLLLVGAPLASAAPAPSREEPVAVLSGMSLFDGTADAPNASLARWRQMLYEARRLSPDGDGWPTVAQIRETGREASGGPIPLAVLDSHWTDRDPDGGAVERDVFAAAALRPWTYRGTDVQLRLERSLWIGRAPSPDREVEIDLGDGLDWRAVPADGRVLATWNTPGTKPVRLRARDGGGPWREAGFDFDVRALATPAPDDTLRINATVPYLGTAGAGDAYVYYGLGHTTLRNPVVVIEGFDLENSYNWEELYALLNQEGLLETLRTRGFDAVVLNFDDATDYLQRNAYVVVAALEQVGALEDGSGSVALVGASMGGLLGRYALAWMEDRAIDANVRTFVSFDAPQKGANIPLGIQYWLDFFSGQSTDAQALLGLLDRPGARQMLLYHHTDPPGATGEPDPLRGTFLTDLTALGDWPSAPRLVAVANGSGNGVDQGFAAGEQVIDYEYGSFLVDVVGNVWALPDGGPGTVFDGLLDFILLPPDEMTVTVSNVLPWDNAPGGFRGSMATMDSTVAPFGDIVALYDNHCFIPTISSLALDVTDPFYDIAGDPDLLTRTPFDAVYYPSVNQIHIGIDAQSAAWFLGELEAGVTAVPEVAVARPGEALRLLPGGPNPFREATTVRFHLDAPRHVTADVFDVTGRRVDRLLDERLLPTGVHEIRWPADGASAPGVGGVYWIRLRSSDGDTRTGRVIRLD